MKSCLLCLTMAALAGMPTSAQTTDELCTVVGQLAEAIMENRQLGVPMSDVLGALGNEHEVGRGIVMDAYRQPRYTSETVAQIEVQEFRIAVENICYQDPEVFAIYLRAISQ